MTRRKRSTSWSWTTCRTSSWSYETILEDLGQNVVTAPLRPGGAAAPAGAGIRRHPARRQHAGHGRLRDGRHDPQPQARRPTRRSSSSPPSTTRCTPPRAIRWGRSITSSRRSCRRSCAPRWGSSSTCTRRRSRSSGRPRSASRWRRSRRRGRRPRRRRGAARSWPRPSTVLATRSTSSDPAAVWPAGRCRSWPTLRRRPCSETRRRPAHGDELAGRRRHRR